MDYLYALLNLGDALNNLRRLDEAENVYRAILTELNNHTLDSLEFQKISGHAYGRLGNSTFMQGKYEESEEYCKKALEIDKELVNILDTDLSYYNLSVGYEHLGRISISKGEFKEADHYYIRCHELRKDLVEKTGDARFRYGLIASYDHLGNIAERQHRYQEAQRYYEQGLEIAIALSEEMGTASSYSALAESYKNVGNALLMQGKTETAKKYLNKSLYVIRILAENLKTVDLRETLASVYLSLGDIEKTGFHLKEAYEYYKSSIEILLALVKETGTNQVYRNLGRIYKRLGDISSAEKNLKEAKEYYMKGADLFLRLVQETGSFESCSDLASAYNSLGIVADSQYNYDEAKEYYKLCIGLQITMAKKTGAPDELIALAYSYNNMGNLLKNQGLLEDAQRHIEKAIEICEMLIAKGGGLEEFNALQGMYLNLGGCLIRDPSQFKIAKDTFQKVIDIEKKTNYPQLKQLANIAKNILREYSTPQKLYKIGDYEYGQGNYINAILWIKEALKTDPNENKEETFSFLRCYYMLGQMYLKCRDKKAALYWLNKIASSDEFAGKMSQPVLHDERFSNIETVSGRVIAEQGGTDFITAFDFHEERNSFAVGYKSGKLIVFDFEHPGKVLYECTESASITRICIDSKYKRYYVTTKDHSIILYDSSFSIIRKFVGKDFILCEPHSLATYYDTAITCYEIGQLTERGSFDLADLAAKTGIDFLKIEEINGNHSSPVILINVYASAKKEAKMAWTRYLIVYDLSNNAVTGIIASEEPLEITTQYSINIQSRNIKKGIISSDGKQITALTDDNRVVIYSKTDGSWYKSDEFAFKDNGERIPIHGLHYSERPNVLYLQIKNRLVQFDLKEKAIVSQV